MKSGFCALRLVFASLSGVLLTGCLLKTSTVSARHFVLAPIPAEQSSNHLSAEIGFVKMPAYLLRDSMVVRNGTNEIEYLENALWGERLDQSFQQTLIANLSHYSPSDNVHLSDWQPDKKTIRIFINVQQFDVDTNGLGKLVAQWRIAAPDSDEPLKSGNTSLARMGVSPRGNPEAIARTMSDLTAEFSHELAQSISGSVKSGTHSR